MLNGCELILAAPSTQFASAMGFSEVVALSRSPSKEAEARGFGASGFLLTGDTGEMEKAGASFDLILNTVSGHGPLDTYLSLLKPRGLLACVGLPDKGKRSQLYLQSAVPLERSLVGSYLGPFADYDEMLEFAANHEITPQVEVVPSEKINSALDTVRQNKARYRVVLEFPSE
jgi:D-arabinose 1-dehydrogenase-like Zn-dependent alcohol dehydrogenase